MADNTQPISVIARLLNLSERRVRQLSAEGVIPKASRGRYELIGAVQGYTRYLRDLALKAEVGTTDYRSERARLVKARADLAEMEAAEKREDLIPAHEVTAAWTEIVVLIRSRLLTIPDKVAPLVHETNTIPEARDVIRKAIYEALTDIASTEVQIEDPDDGALAAGKGRRGGAQGGGTAAGADHQSVGGSEPPAQ